MKIGCDIEDISRFKDKDDNFLSRIFSSSEIQYCKSFPHPTEHFCARFCAKEALVKALSDKSLKFNEIEILNDENGKPYLKYKDVKSELSLSHCKTYAMAVVIVEE